MNIQGIEFLKSKVDYTYGWLSSEGACHPGVPALLGTAKGLRQLLASPFSVSFSGRFLFLFMFS